MDSNVVAAPGLRAGRGLKPLRAIRRAPFMSSSARPSGRARIETLRAWRWLITSVWAAPGLRAGRGLKPVEMVLGLVAGAAAPGLRAGRGLKLQQGHHQQGQDRGSARPSGRARIETRSTSASWKPRQGSARPSGRARIETHAFRWPPGRTGAAPGLRAGRGLKRVSRRQAAMGVGAGSARPSGRARIETWSLH